ncbi:hypothetical protein [Bradyrhizobium erythrophlei]|uniref:Uncharacterized protein n=1 Tax=Bradyrhizobium erythrophlei TaxID=1437360 RepID=A0A1M5R539_9BRAD|nr:hypothetical protein [Bradyrhizobium erythrophlei]SHH20913.1 hypothetical protein SAMN05444169_6325 [Bradyrhizobium erythrophlei]
MSRLAKSEITVPAIAASSSVERCIALLDTAARGENVATAMFEAVVMIQRGREDRVTDGSIDPEQRGMLLMASVRAQTGAATHLPTDYDRASLNIGMWAMAYQITMWAESLDKTSRRNSDDVLDFHDGARVLQNELENIVLREKIAERARSRLARNLPSHVPVYSV